jgi:hypothetical protein
MTPFSLPEDKTMLLSVAIVGNVDGEAAGSWIVRQPPKVNLGEKYLL